MILFWCVVAVGFGATLVVALENRSGWVYFLAACGLILTLLIIASLTVER